MSDRKIVHQVDEVLPGGKLFLLGLQHVLVMYAGAVAVPLILGSVKSGIIPKLSFTEKGTGGQMRSFDSQIHIRPE